MNVVPQSDLDRDLSRLEGDLKQLEAEYNMFFAGRLAKPPWESRARVEKTVRTLDHAHIQNTGVRFRFSTLQSRYATFVDLWDRGQRARDEGRPGPFAHPSRDQQDRKVEPGIRVLHVAAFHDPLREVGKLEDLYESLASARREAGAAEVPFHKFASVVKAQVEKMKAAGSPEVAFRVTLTDGKVSFTARALKAVQPDVPQAGHGRGAIGAEQS